MGFLGIIGFLAQPRALRERNCRLSPPKRSAHPRDDPSHPRALEGLAYLERSRGSSANTHALAATSRTIAAGQNEEASEKKPSSAKLFVHQASAPLSVKCIALIAFRYVLLLASGDIPNCL